MSMTSPPRTDPSAVLRYRDGIYAVDLISAALLDFDFFTWLRENPGTLDEICEGLGWQPRPADVLVTLCKANHFVTETDDGTLRVTELAREHLSEGSPWCLKSYFESLKDRPVTRGFVKVLKTGKPANWNGHKDAKADWHGAMENGEFAQVFTAAMDCRGVFLGKALAEALRPDLPGRKHVLDIAGGSGVYACALAANRPHLTATVLEQEPVASLAAKFIAGRELADRVDISVGDIFQGDYPEGCDVHLFSNVLHDWDVPEIETLLGHSHRAMPSGGLIVIHDAFLNSEKTGPLPVAEYSCLLAHSTQGRCYSHREMSRFLEAAGFQSPRFLEAACDRGVVVADKG